jgi:hypothetical protein
MKWLNELTPASVRFVAGAGAFILAMSVLLMIFFKPELAKDDLFKMLAQAAVIQGFVGAVLAFSFKGSEPKGE